MGQPSGALVSEDGDCGVGEFPASLGRIVFTAFGDAGMLSISGPAGLRTSAPYSISLRS